MKTAGGTRELDAPELYASRVEKVLTMDANGSIWNTTELTPLPQLHDVLLAYESTQYIDSPSASDVAVMSEVAHFDPRSVPHNLGCSRHY